MFGDDPPVLADYDAVGIGMNLDRTPDCVGCHRVLVVVEATRQVFDTTPAPSEAVEPAGIGTSFGRSLRTPPDRLVGQLRMAMRLGVGDAFVEQPSVQFVKILEPQPRREEPLAHEPNLVLDLPLLPARSRVQATGSTR